MNSLQNTHSFVYYQDKDFYYFWKPAGISSTWWKTACFLDLLINENTNLTIKNIIDSQYTFFWKEKELWLLNRLDLATTGLLYFAKSPKVYSKFRELQKEVKIDKYYIAMTYGNISHWIKQNGNIIKFPIMHHKFADDRMIVIKNPEDIKKWKWNQHFVTTEMCETEYLEKENLSVLIIKIHKWIRHQIRAHLSSIGFPICGDDIYCKSKNQEFNKLQLFSIWLHIE